MPYDIVDAYEEIRFISSEVAQLKKKLEEEGIIKKDKEGKKNDNSRTS
ncbi:MAG: hypothetical protein ACE5D6_07195 [Candidatus Zixiibacteriota bacterium]